MKVALLIAVSALSLIVISTANADKTTETKQEQIQEQLARYYHADGYIKSIGKAARRTIYSSNFHTRNSWQRTLRRLIRVRADARTKITALRAPSWPLHHKLWLCIHGGEANWDDPNSGNNGHYGGLQMTRGWLGEIPAGHTANEYTQLEQEQFAEHGYKKSRYSRSWLQGQWGQTIGPCWQYA